MRLSAKSDYAVRAMLELALADRIRPRPVLTCERVATAQDVPVKFLRNVIMVDLKRAGLVLSTRGPEGGYRLGREPSTITVADVIRAVDGPIATVQGDRPQDVTYTGTAEVLGPLWVAVRAALRSVLEQVTLDDLAEGALPPEVAALLEDPAAWTNP